MKKRINLLIYHDKYKKAEMFFLRLRKVIYFLLFSSILGSLLILIILNNNKNELDRLITEKKYLENQINKKKDVDLAYQIFSRKFLQLKNILDSDVNFYPYYKLIDDGLKKATISAFLKSIEITKTKDTNFTISFKDFNELINFLNYIEDINFLTYFNQLTLKNITLDQKTMLNQIDKQYNLNLVGQFKK